MPKKTDAANPRDWLAFARIDLQAVEALVRQQTAYTVCRGKLAEALEKILKADLISRGWRLRKIHDLQALRDDLATYDTERAAQLQFIVDELAESYTQMRYPGFDLADDDWPALLKLQDIVRQYCNQVESQLA